MIAAGVLSFFYKYYIKKFKINQIFCSLGKIWKTAHFPLGVVTNPVISVASLTLNGGADRTRTRHILGANEVLFQMSYDPIKLTLCIYNG